MTTILSIIAAIAGYLVGSIPFAFLFVMWIKKIDIRTVGSGNVGATNAARVLGFRFFLIIFALDLLKGFVPTFVFPRLVELAAGTCPEWLPVAVALTTIVGHNYPVYLGFRGGKGVASSFGALLALDLTSSLAALAAFLIFLIVTRFVSLSSLLGGVVFVVVHFYGVTARGADPFSAREWPMSALTLLLMLLVIIRHRTNFWRLLKGTEPRIGLPKSNNGGSSGFAPDSAKVEKVPPG